MGERGVTLTLILSLKGEERRWIPVFTGMTRGWRVGGNGVCFFGKF